MSTGCMGYHVNWNRIHARYFSEPFCYHDSHCLFADYIKILWMLRIGTPIIDKLKQIPQILLDFVGNFEKNDC